VTTQLATSPARARVAAIVDAMAAGRWERGKTAAEIGAALGCKASTVESDAATVAHVLDHVMTHRERLATTINGRVDAIVQRFEPSSDPQEATVALTGLRDIARNAGIGLAKGDTNVQVNVNAGDEDLEAMLLDLGPKELAIVARPDVWAALERQVKAYRRGVVEVKGEP
jgi:hypothetical protein